MYGDQPLGFTLVAAVAVPQYHIVLGSGANYGGLAGAGSSYASLVGVAQNAPNAGEHLSVAIMGRTRCYVNSAVTPFAAITSAGSGRACPAASGDTAIGFALETAAAGDLTSVMLTTPYRYN